MKISINILSIIIYVTSTIAQRTVLDKLTIHGRVLRKILNNAYEKEARTRNYIRDLQISQRAQDVIAASTPFPCSLDQFRSRVKPTSVHRLRPGDIDVIGAIGDSLTAGYGALSTNFFNLFREYRGASFLSGGQETWRKYLTIPNIIKEFNPNLVGYALASSSTIDKDSQFNVAEGGAVSSDIVYMTKVLLKRIINDNRVNITSDWKMINICIGANDFCLKSCYETNPENILDKHRKNLVTVLRLLRDNLPRTFVNIIPPPNVHLLKEFTRLPDSCQVTHTLSCPCFIGERFKFLGPILDNIVLKWKEIEMEIANYEEFDTDDFTAVIQPAFQETVLPRTPTGEVDYTYFAVDCFHFSQRGHALVSNALWNNIISPVGQKQTTIISRNFNCPSDQNPYLFTKKNSNN